MSARERLHAHTRFEETLPSGLLVTLRLPRLRDCIIAGQVPLPVVARMMDIADAVGQNGNAETPKDTPAVTTEDATHTARFLDEIVRRSVIAIEGEPIEMTLEDVGEFSQDDYDHIAGLAFRDRVSPKAGSPA